MGHRLQAAKNHTVKEMDDGYLLSSETPVFWPSKRWAGKGSLCVLRAVVFVGSFTLAVAALFFSLSPIRTRRWRKSASTGVHGKTGKNSFGRRFPDV